MFYIISQDDKTIYLSNGMTIKREEVPFVDDFPYRIYISEHIDFTIAEELGKYGTLEEWDGAWSTIINKLFNGGYGLLMPERHMDA